MRRKRRKACIIRIAMTNQGDPRIYCDLFKRLEADGIRYVVTSGVAVVLHGHIRPIFDLDLVVDPAPQEAHRALRTLTMAGFVPTLPLPLEMVSVMRMFDGGGREVDLFVRYHIPFAELWATSELVDTGDGAARVISREHIIKVKRMIGRPHDLQDVEGLLDIWRQ